MKIHKILITLGFAGALTSACAKPNQNQQQPVDPAPQTTIQDQGTQATNIRTDGVNENVPADNRKGDVTSREANIGSTNASKTSSTGTQSNSTLNNDIIRRAQEELNRKGFNVPVNGMLESRTQQAVRNFQRDIGLQPTGSLDKATLNALQVATDSVDNRAPASIAEPIN